MKYHRLVIIIILLTLTANTVMAQGLYRNQRGQRGYTPPPKPLEVNAYDKKMDANAIANAQLPTYSEVLKLDDFQKELVKNILIDHFTKREVLRTDFGLSFGDKQDAYTKLDEELHTELATILSPEQVEAFKKVQFIDDKKLLKEEKRKKKKKRKRDKKNKEKEGTH